MEVPRGVEMRYERVRAGDGGHCEVDEQRRLLAVPAPYSAAQLV